MIGAALAGVEEAIVFVQDELYNLILEDHVHSDILRLHLGPEQSRTKDNGHVLHGHAIVVPVLNDPVRGDGKKTIILVSRHQESVFSFMFGNTDVTSEENLRH